jgi:hypothetical protein
VVSPRGFVSGEALIYPDKQHQKPRPTSKVGLLMCAEPGYFPAGRAGVRFSRINRFISLAGTSSDLLNFTLLTARE